MSTTYTVNQLASLTGISIKTLHLYDKLGLLKPAIRTESRYRLYQEKELLRLQQILFYKELDFPLKEIIRILDDPDFNLIRALEGHKKLLQLKKARIHKLLKTVDNTIYSLKNNMMLNMDELYDGLSPEEAMEYRAQAIKAYGNEAVTKAEDHLKTLSKDEMKRLVSRQKELAKELYLLKDQNHTTLNVQRLIHEHYLNTRVLWGTHNATDKQAEAYKGLGKLYLTDERFTAVNEKTDAEFTAFICNAMVHYADQELS